MKKLITVILTFLISNTLTASDYYFSPAGVDTGNCTTGGGKVDPWQSVTNKADCILKGDRIILMQGNYYDTNNYPFYEGRIELEGEPGEPIYITSDSDAAVSYPAKLWGSFLINSKHLIIDGIEFIRNVDETDILSIGDSYHVTIVNSSVHGDADDYQQASGTNPTGDCIKIAGGETHVEYITIKNSEIYNCAQDAIDVTGRKNISYVGNEIHHARIMQVKGGSENILIANNYIHDMLYGVMGQGMNCTEDDTGYCGSPELPDMPVDQRFQAKNIVIKDNFFENISKPAIAASGWKNVSIFRNLFSNAATTSGAYHILFNAGTKSAFFDQRALDYCQEYPEECGSCTSTEGACVFVRSRADDIRITRNKFIHDPQAPGNSNSRLRVITLETDAVDRIESVCLDGNTYVSPLDPLFETVKHNGASNRVSSTAPEDRGICSQAPVGIAKIDNNWSSISIPNQSATSVIFLTPPSQKENDPGVARMKNIALSGGKLTFELAFSEWDYLESGGVAQHVSEDVAFLYLQEGVYTQDDGSVWQVGKFSIDKTNSNAEQFHSISFSQGFLGVPHLFLTVQTANGSETVSIRANDVNSTGFKASLQEQQTTATSSHTSEEIGYLAIYNPSNSGVARINGYTFSYRLHKKQIDEDFSPVWNGEFQMEEEQSSDSEVVHTAENVDFLLIDGQVFAQDVDYLGSDTAAIRRRSSSQAVLTNKYNMEP